MKITLIVCFLIIILVSISYLDLYVLSGMPMAASPSPQIRSYNIPIFTKYVNNHNYIIFHTSNSIAVVHDESCISRSHNP